MIKEQKHIEIFGVVALLMPVLIPNKLAAAYRILIIGAAFFIAPP